MSIWMAVFLGLVQGVTEFLPVSSSGHLSIIQNLFNVDYMPENHLFFDVLLHLGTLGAVCMFYWKDLKTIARDTGNFLTGREDRQNEQGRLKPTVRTAFLVLIGTLPLLVIVPFNGRIEDLYYNTPFISFTLIVTGCLLFVSGKLSDGRKNARTATVTDAILVGAGQAIATIPGLSRSGTTITVALACGMRREYAVRFSFLLSIPAIIGSVLLTTVNALRTGVDWSSFPAYLLGMLVAWVTGFLCLRFIRALVVNHSLNGFAYYCWFAGVLSLFLSFIL